MHAQPLSRGQLFEIPWTADPRLLSPWNFPGKNIGAGCHFLLQRTYLTQEGSKLYLCIGRQILTTVPPGKPQITFILHGKRRILSGHVIKMFTELVTIFIL